MSSPNLCPREARSRARSIPTSAGAAAELEPRERDDEFRRQLSCRMIYTFIADNRQKKGRAHHEPILYQQRRRPSALPRVTDREKADPDYRYGGGQNQGIQRRRAIGGRRSKPDAETLADNNYRISIANRALFFLYRDSETKSAARLPLCRQCFLVAIICIV